MWSGLGRNEVVTTHPKSNPATSRKFPSLANYSDNYIFVIAGRNPDAYAQYASVDYYTIGIDTWSQAPPLNTARISHSSCVAGDTLCVFGGSGNGGKLNSIEMLKLDKFYSGVIEQG